MLFNQLFIQPPAAQRQLLQSNLPSGQLRLEITVRARFLLLPPALLLALLFEAGLIAAQLGDALFD